MRRFELHRHEDATGVSGIGVVAQGVRFEDGTCAMRWLTVHASTAIYTSAEDIELIHGHEGRTRLVWLDHPVTPDPAVPTAARRQNIIAKLRSFE